MSEGNGSNSQEDRSTPLEELTKKCMDAEGYVIFAGRLSNRVDEQGNRVLEFDYRRYHLSFEDVKTSVIKFKEAFLDDIREGIPEV